MFSDNLILRICTVAALAAPASGVLAQQRPNTVLERQIIESALQTIENYEATVTLCDDDAYYSFLELFVDDNVVLYNDLLGSSASRTLPLKEYIHAQRDGLRNIIVNISDISRDDIWRDDDGTWHISFRLNKHVSYSTKCAIYLSSNDYYGSPYVEKMNLVYNEARKVCLIEKIEGSVYSRKAPLGENYYVLQQTSPYDKAVTVTTLTGETLPVAFNKHDQMLLPSDIDTERAFRYPDSDVTTVVSVDQQCHTVTLGYKSRRWRVRPNAGIGLGDYYRLSVADDVFSTKTSGFECGVDFGYTFPSQSRLKTSVNLGIGMATSSISMDMRETNYSYYDRYYDVDGDEYIRHYRGVQGHQKLNACHFTVPLYADFDVRVNPYVSAYLDLGVKPYVKMSGESDKLDMSVKQTYGVYPLYDNLLIDDRWPHNGFSKDQHFSKSSGATASFSTFALDIMGGAGLRVYPVRGLPLSLDLGVSYQHSVLDFWSASHNELRTGNTDINNAIVCYNGREEQVRSLTDAVTAAKHQLLRVNVGLIYKF